MASNARRLGGVAMMGSWGVGGGETMLTTPFLPHTQLSPPSQCWDWARAVHVGGSTFCPSQLWDSFTLGHPNAALTLGPPAIRDVGRNSGFRVARMNDVVANVLANQIARWGGAFLNRSREAKGKSRGAGFYGIRGNHARLLSWRAPSLLCQ